MAKSIGFRVRFPHFGLFLVIAIVLAIPLTVFSVQNVSTQTNSHAFGDSDGQNCKYTPSWTLVSHTDSATSVKYRLTISSKCPNITVGPMGSLFNDFTVSARIPTGWYYIVSPSGGTFMTGCGSKNHICYFTINNSNTATVYLTVGRPTTTKSGTYTIPVYGQNFDSPTAIKNLSYIVIN